MSLDYNKLPNNLISVIVIVVTLNTIALAIFLSFLQWKISAADEMSRPASLQVSIIKDSSCPNCFDIESALASVRKGNIEIEKEESFDFSDPKARELIEKYGIEKIPTMLFSGEIEKDENIIKAWEKIGVVNDDRVVFTAVKPPFVDTKTGGVSGLVALTSLVDKSCIECFDVATFEKVLGNFGVFYSVKKQVDISSSEGKRLVSEYNITKVPTVILDSEVSNYSGLVTTWTQVGTVEDDGNYVMRDFSFLKGFKYKDLEKGEVTQY